MAKRSRTPKDICVPDNVETKYAFVLSWIKNRLGADEIRHGIVLVAGIRAWPDGLDADQLAEMAEALTGELTRAIEEHGGAIQSLNQSQVVAFWNCKDRLHDPMALRGAFAAAQQIVRGSSGLPRPSVILEAGRIHVSWQPDGQSRHMTSMAVEAALQCFLLARPGSISISPAVDTILAAFACRTKPGVDQGKGRLRPASEPDKSARASISETIDVLASDPVCGQLIPSTRAQIAHASGGLTDLAFEIARLIASGAVPADATRQDDERTSAVSVLAFCRLDATGKFKPFLRAAALFGDAIDAETLAAALSLDKSAVTPLFDWAIEFALMEPLAQPIGGRHRIRSRSARRYRFTSPLLREAAYRSIPARTRRRLHAQIATAMQEHHAMGADIDPAAIADQFARAERNEDAIRWWRHAAEAAIASSASQTAVSHLEVALAHIAPASTIATSDAIADLTRLYGPQLSALKGNASSEVLTVYEQRSTAHGFANSAHLPHQFDSLWGIQTCYLVRGELDKACQNSAQLMASAFAIGTTEHRILALRLHALLEFLLGNLDLARDHYHSVLSLYDPERHAALRHTYASDQAALAHAHLAWTYVLLDDQSSSQAAAEKALARAEQLDHPHTLAHTLCVLAAAHLNARQIDKSAPLALAARAIAQRQDFLYWGAWSRLILAIGELQRPNAASSSDLIDAIETYRATGARQILPLAFAALAEHHLATGDLRGTQFALRMGLGESSETGVAVFLPMLHRISDHSGIIYREANRSYDRP